MKHRWLWAPLFGIRIQRAVALTGVSALLFVLAGARMLTAQQVSAKSGNVVYRDAGGIMHTITTAGLDSEAVLSPNGRWIAFLRTSQTDSTDSMRDDRDMEPLTDLFIVDTSGFAPRLLLRGGAMERAVPHGFPDALTGIGFSNDGATIYARCRVAPTGDALYAVSVSTGAARRVTFADDYEVIRSGPNRGRLLVSQSSIWRRGGRVWAWYLFAANGTRLAFVTLDARPDAAVRLAAVGARTARPMGVHR